MIAYYYWIISTISNNTNTTVIFMVSYSGCLQYAIPKDTKRFIIEQKIVVKTAHLIIKCNK